MLSQEYPKLQIDLSSAHEEDLTKATRLSEVKKGADFTKMINELAEQQWRGTSVMPRIMETEERDTSRKDGDGAAVSPEEMVIKPSEQGFKFDEPKLLQMSNITVPSRRTTPLEPMSRQAGSGRSSKRTLSRELQNQTAHSRREALLSGILSIETTNNKNNKHYQKINNNINNNDMNNMYSGKPVLPDISGRSFRDPSSVDLEDLYFNTWGVRDPGMDSKVVPDPVPRVVAPKQSVPSSRVASQNRDRHLRTQTDFRSSRNGFVRIAQPPMPLPPISASPYPEVDVDTLKREKTYVTLKRIDQILNPQLAYFNSELNSSELEILGSGSTTPRSDKKSDKKKKKRENRDKLQKDVNKLLEQSKHNTGYINHSGGVTVVHTIPGPQTAHLHSNGQQQTFQNGQVPLQNGQVAYQNGQTQPPYLNGQAQQYQIDQTQLYQNGQYPLVSQPLPGQQYHVQYPHGHHTNPYPHGQYPHSFPHPPPKHAKAQKSSTRVNKSKDPNRSLSPVLKCLGTEKLTSYEKCMKWVDKCSEWYD